MSPVGAVQDGQLFELSATGSHTPVGTVNLDPNDTTTSSTYTFDFDFSEIGITSANSFQFVATYLNQSNVWRSNEAIGDIASFPNPGGHSALTFTAARTYPMSSVVGLPLSIDAFLQGAYDTSASTNIMSDGLRAAGNIPTTSPYGDGATIESTVLDVVTGEESNAIVDWVQVSLHDPTDTSVVISTVPALLQRNGNVVALDGSSALQIQGVAGDYKVSINHRNHIPVITDATQSLSTTETAIDFTNDLTIVTGGSNAMAEVATGIYALFSGDVNGNNQVQVDDYNAAIQDVGRGGYLASDVDMNGELQVSDINFVLKTLGKGAQF